MLNTPDFVHARSSPGPPDRVSRALRSGGDQGAQARVAELRKGDEILRATSVFRHRAPRRSDEVGAFIDSLRTTSATECGGGTPAGRAPKAGGSRPGGRLMRGLRQNRADPRSDVAHPRLAGAHHPRVRRLVRHPAAACVAGQHPAARARTATRHLMAAHGCVLRVSELAAGSVSGDPPAALFEGESRI